MHLYNTGSAYQIVDGNGYLTVPFEYGISMVYRVAKIEAED